MPPRAPARYLSAQRQRSQLPAEVTGFVGRKAELAGIAALLGNSRLVTVLGAAGIGKTRVALRLAAQVEGGYRHGVCLVELSGLRDPELLVNAVADALRLPEQDARARADAVFGHLSDRRMLLVLDTCEHLIDACALFAERVLSGAPGVTLLATSRQPLDVIGEHTFLVPQLPVPESAEAPDAGGDAVDLFAQRAAAAVPGFRVTAANRPEVIQLCRHLDGMPLAIELAAVRLRALPLSELSRRLEHRFQVLSGGRRGAVPRHQTLRTAIGWSYELCTPAEQELWARLSVFPGPFDVSALHEVCADPGVPPEQSIATLVALVDKCVVQRERGDGTRYQMLDTLREFGAERLAADGRETELRDRLLARCLRLARRFDKHFLDAEQTATFHALRREHANIRAALSHALDTQPAHRPREREGAALATALHFYWHISGLLEEGRYWLDKVLTRFAAPSAQQAWALAVRGRLATFQGNTTAALADIRAGVQMARELGDGLVLAHGTMYLNLALAFAGQHEQAEAAGAEAVLQLEAAGHRIGLVCIQPQLAHLCQLVGDLDRALQLCAAGLAMIGDDSGEQWITSGLHLVAGFALFQQPGREAECTLSVTKALQLKHELGDLVGTAYALELLGWLAAREGRHERAAWLIGAAASLWSRAGQRLSGTAILEQFHQRAVGTARESLGEKRYATLAASAARRPLHLVVGQALAGADELREREGDGSAEPGIAAGLTAREREIAGLVATGLSNREIAGRLFISKRTVDAHIEHIFGKLGISSRVQLTVWLRDRLASESVLQVAAPLLLVLDRLE